jgi:hypothetical protein
MPVDIERLKPLVERSDPRHLGGRNRDDSDIVATDTASAVSLQREKKWTFLLFWPARSNAAPDLLLIIRRDLECAAY